MQAKSALAPLFAKYQSRRAQAAWSLSEAPCTVIAIAVFWPRSSKPVEPPLTDAAAEPCRTALPPAARGAWRRLKRGGRCLRPADPDQEFHNMRKEAKRARYTAELIAPLIGGGAAKGSDRFIHLVTEVQDVLGEHQDAVVAAHEIELGLAEYADRSRLCPGRAGVTRVRARQGPGRACRVLQSLEQARPQEIAPMDQNAAEGPLRGLSQGCPESWITLIRAAGPWSERPAAMRACKRPRLRHERDSRDRGRVGRPRWPNLLLLQPALRRQVSGRSCPLPA